MLELYQGHLHLFEKQQQEQPYSLIQIESDLKMLKIEDTKEGNSAQPLNPFSPLHETTLATIFAKDSLKAARKLTFGFNKL